MAESGKAPFRFFPPLGWFFHPFFRHSATVFLLSIAGGGLNLVCRIVVGRMLTGEQYGEMETALQVGAYLMMPLSTLSLLLIRQIAEAEGLNDRARLQAAVWTVGKWIFLYSAASAAVLLFVGPLLRDWFRYNSLWPFAATGSLSLSGAGLVVGAALLQGTRKFWRNGLMGLAGPLVRIFVSWGLIGMGFGATGAIGALAFSNVVMGTVGLLLGWKLLFPWRPSAILPQGAFVRSLVPLTLIFWLGGLVGGVDLFFVKRMFDPWLAGDYARVSAVVRQVMMLNGFLAVTLFPWVAAEKAGGRGTGHLLLRALGIALLMALGAAMAFTIVPRLILGLFYGEVTPVMMRWTPRLAWVLVPGSLIPLLLQYVMARAEYGILKTIGPAVAFYVLLLAVFRQSVEGMIAVMGLGLWALVVLMVLTIMRNQRGGGEPSHQAATSTPSDSSE